MCEYRVWFSFYSEESGNFDDVAYTVQAGNSFDAREKAWLEWDQQIDSKFQSCVKLYAVTWQPNPLDMGDYFYSHAADIKQAVGHIENVEITNGRIEKQDNEAYYKLQKHYYLGALQTVDAIAKDLYADKGIVPPSIYEELYYAQEICYQLEYGNQFNAFQKKIDQAKKWDEHGYLFDMRDLFKRGYITLDGETVSFKSQFGRNGIYPAYNDLEDTEYKYISRWQNTFKISVLSRLRPVQESDVIPNSAEHMSYYGQHLLINTDHFHPDYYEKPENLIWITDGETEIKPDFTGEFPVENVITGRRLMCKRNDFAGALRPDITARYDFEALKAEYAAVSENQNETETEDEYDEEI
jgi:hypothetical protein